MIRAGALAVVCVILLAAQLQAEINITDVQKEKLLQHHNACASKFDLGEETLKNLLDGVFPEQQAFKDYLLCISKRVGFQNEAGLIQKDVIVEKLKQSIEDPSKAEEFTNKCIAQDGSPAEVVYKVVACLQSSTPKLIVGQ